MVSTVKRSTSEFNTILPIIDVNLGVANHLPGQAIVFIFNGTVDLDADYRSS
jgi:hypothetical protein